MEKEVSKITGQIVISPAILSEIQKEVKNVPNFKKKIEEVLSKRTTEILEIVLGGAFFLDASDIHIEPEEEKAKLRARIDGVLQDVVVINQKIYDSLIPGLNFFRGLN